MKKWHPLALVRVCGYQMIQGFSLRPADHRIAPAPVLSDSTQLYLTGGHSKMVCQTSLRVVCVLIYHIDNAYGMESNVSEYTRDRVRTR